MQHRAFLPFAAHEELAYDEGRLPRAGLSLAGWRLEHADADHEGVGAGAAAQPAGLRVQKRGAGKVEVCQVGFGVERDQGVQRLAQAGGQRVTAAQGGAGVDNLAHKAGPVRRLDHAARHERLHAACGRRRH